MKRTLAVAVLSLFVASPPADAQLVPTWARTHDAPPMQSDQMSDIAVDASGAVWITGTSFDAPTTTRSIETVKYDAAGNIVWRARYQSPLGGWDSGTALALAPLGAVVVAGNSLSIPLTGSGQQTVVKYDALGAQAWAWQFGALAGVNVANAVLVDASGDIYVGGMDEALGTQAMCVRKLDGNGTELWTATYDGAASGQDAVNALAFAPNGDIVAAGYTSSSSNLAVMRVDPNGVVLWAVEESGGAFGVESALSVAVDAAGNAYAAGQLITGSTDSDQALVAYDFAGNHLWTRTRDGSAHGPDVFTKVSIDPLGRVVAAGRLFERGTASDFSVAVYTPAGALAWAREWGGAANDHDTVRGLAFDSAGRVYVGGMVNLSTISEGRILVYDQSGTELFNVPYGDGVKPVEFLDIEKGPGESLYVGGNYDRGVGTGDYLTVLFDRLALPFCAGDGSGTACPCANNGSAARGCANSSFGSGAWLSASGTAGAAAGTDTLVLTANAVPGAGLFLQSTGQQGTGAGLQFGDGLLCVGGTLTRLGVVFPTGSSASYPGGLTPSPIHIAGGTASGDVRHYQCWYRDAITYCTANTFNLTQGLTIVWGP